MEIALFILCAAIIGTLIFWLWVVKLKPFAATLMSIATWFFAGYLYVSVHVGFHAPWWQEYPSMRHRMVNDLVESNQLVGLSEAEVISLLGPADDNWEYTQTESSPESLTAERVIIYYTYPPAIMASLEYRSLWVMFEKDTVLFTSNDTQ